MTIYLIGYRCTGKTSVGRMLAEKIGWRFVDSDYYVVKKAGMSIAEMVVEHGWDYFRHCEKQAIAELDPDNQLVVATGGGIILDPTNRDLLKESDNLVLWLQAKIETIYDRMKNDAESNDFRPSLTNSALHHEIMHTLAERTPFYESVADFTVTTDGRVLEDVCETILKLLGDTEALRD